ncbi:hypothetical protein G5I_05245 [Acromyrmex echinatior]|uniref:DDE Tnp4 domain-containing protein n=1 Tax=Acromyrmex echinatior TaxID=103372 RepID=F4WHS5_ACREC|nr:hypothetical protein G5I_05245 [Acromyrmex echinatior]
MAFRNRIHCFTCDVAGQPRVMKKLDGDNNENKRQIAIRFRQDLRRPIEELRNESRLCMTCFRLFESEIDMQDDPICIRLNVLKQSDMITCLICNANNNVHRLSPVARVFISVNVYIPDEVRSCPHHLAENDFLLQALLPDFKLLSSMTKEQFRELLQYCDPVPEPNGHRYVYEKDLLAFLCKLRQGLCDDFLRVLFNYQSRQAVSLAVATPTQGRHLVKPALIVAPDGYILDIHGPYFADSKNNDAAMLRNEFQADAGTLREWLGEDAIVIVDRGYRDVLPLLQALGIDYKMPAFLQQGQRQLDTAEANDSRLVTKSRWIIEARNGHIKSIFKFFKNTISVVHAINLRAFYLIAEAIINRYRDVILMDGATAELAEQMLQKARSENTLRLRVETEHLARRNAMWNRFNDNKILDFPRLDIDFLKELTVGIYQIRLAPAYIQDKLVRDESEVFELDEHRNEAGFLRVRVFSILQCNEASIMDCLQTSHGDENNEPITGYYCTCVSGSRILGSCAHVASVLWFLGYARHQPNTKYPSVTLLNHIKDAANRYNQDEEIEGEVIEPF